MGKDFVKDIEVRIEVLPHHKFIGIKNIDADGYFAFWELQEKISGLDCHTATGILESMGGMFGQVGGWFYEDGRKGYLYGVQMPGNYTGQTPNGMVCLDIPEGEYAVFYHPPFNYEEICESVDAKVAETAGNFDPAPRGYQWDCSKPDYQRHDPEQYGTAIYRPLRKANK